MGLCVASACQACSTHLHGKWRQWVLVLSPHDSHICAERWHLSRRGREGSWEDARAAVSSKSPGKCNVSLSINSVPLTVSAYGGGGASWGGSEEIVEIRVQVPPRRWTWTIGESVSAQDVSMGKRPTLSEERDKEGPQTWGVISSLAAKTPVGGLS